MNIAQVLGAAAILAAVATGVPSPAWAGGPTTYIAHFPAPAAPGGELSGIYTFTVQTGNTTTWTITPCGPGCATVAATNSSAGNAPYTRASAVGRRPLEHDGCAARRPHVRRQQPCSGDDHIFLGRRNIRRHSVQPRGPRCVWQNRPRRSPRSYVRVHIDESRLSELWGATGHSRTDGVVLRLLQSRDIGRTPS